MGRLNKVTAAIWRTFQRADGGKTPGPGDDFWYGPIGHQTHVGLRVTPDIAMKSSALFAVVKVLSETMASLPLQIYRELGEGAGREPAPDHPLDELIRYQPNQRNTAAEFRETIIMHSAIMGTGYAEIVPGARGAVDQLKLLNPSNVNVELMPDDSLRFKVSNPRTGEQRILLQEEMFRVPGLSADGISGMRVVDVAAEAIGIGLAADGYAARIFSNNLNVGGYLKHPGQLSPEAQKNFIQAFVERTAGVSNAHRPIVLQEGMEFIRASDSAKDSQLIEARKWQIGEIARFWRVPLHMLNIDDQTNRSTVEAQALDFVKYTVRPWARRIEQAIRRDLIVAKRTYTAKFNMDALLRGDAGSRADYFAKALGSGGHPAWLTQQEVRQVEGLNPEPTIGELAPGANAVTDESAPVAVLPVANAERLVRKETAAIRRAQLRFVGEQYQLVEWVKAFYAGHVSCVMEFLDIEKEFARAYCDHVRDEVLNAIEHGELDALLENWEANRADEIRKAANNE